MINILVLCILVIFSKCLYARDDSSENLTTGLHQLFLGHQSQQIDDEEQVSIHYQMAEKYLEPFQGSSKSKTKSSKEQSYSESDKVESLYETPKKQILPKRDSTKHLVGSSLDELTAKTGQLTLSNEEDWSDSDSSRSSLDSDEEYVSDREIKGKNIKSLLLEKQIL